MIAIIDYDAGNMKSVEKALQKLGQEVIITRDPEEILSADKVILPGVGSFGDAMGNLRKYHLDQVIYQVVERNIPFLGICLSLQLLFEKSYEYGEHDGLGLLKGSIVPMKGRIDESLKIPHIGWNQLHFERPHFLFQDCKEGDYVYFVHSYYAVDCQDSLLSTTDYGVKMTAAVGKDNVLGCQFHPEKSGEVGLKILRAFCEYNN